MVMRMPTVSRVMLVRERDGSHEQEREVSVLRLVRMLVNTAPVAVQIRAGHALAGAAKSFAENELAYLALTSKVEHPIRDRVAWALHSTLTTHFVAREWRRCDLAILETNGSPAALVEAKAMYSYDAVSDRKMAAYRGWMVSDIAKANKLASGSSAEVFVLLLVTHVVGLPDAPDGVVKYRRHIERATAPHLLVRSRTAIRECVADLGVARNEKLCTGNALGVDVSLEYWLIGPAARQIAS